MDLIAGIAQLVEHKLPKLGVASSNLVARSSIPLHCAKYRPCSCVVYLLFKKYHGIPKT